MTAQMFDALARRASAVISRRGTLLTLSGAGTAALAGSSMARANNNTKKKARKQGKKKCQKQVGQCRAFWEESCELAGEDCDESILQELLTCCEFLGQCQNVDFFECIVEAQTPPIARPFAS